MKFFFLILVVFVASHSFAQCDTPVKFKSIKARGLASVSAETEVNLETVITLADGKFVMVGTFQGETEEIGGEILEVLSCEWKKFLVDGKAVYRVLAAKEGQEPMKSILEIVSDNNYPTITIFGEESADSKLKIIVSEYEALPASGAQDNKAQKKKKS